LTESNVWKTLVQCFIRNQNHDRKVNGVFDGVNGVFFEVTSKVILIEFERRHTNATRFHTLIEKPLHFVIFMLYYTWKEVWWGYERPKEKRYNSGIHKK